MMPTLVPPAPSTLAHARRRRPAASRRLALAALGLALATVAGACGEGSGTNSLSDSVKPHLTLVAGQSPDDSTVAFSVHATDNLGLLAVKLRLTAPGLSGDIDTTFNSVVTAYDQSYALRVPSSIAPGTPITVVGTAVDGARNVSAPDTINVTTGPGIAAVVITNPKSGDTAVVGFSFAISISGKTHNKVRALGYIASGVFPTAQADSVVFTSPLKDSTAIDTAVSLVGASRGTLTLTPFMLDSIGTRLLGPAVNVLVTDVVPTNSVPTVSCGTTDRIEVTDTIHVEGRDRAGIRWLGYEVSNLPSDPQALAVRDSFAVSGSVSSAVHTFQMNLPVTSFPKSVGIRCFAYNTNGTIGYAQANGVTVIDTVGVVAGLTRPIPNGGTVADALYHPRTNTIYLSNIERNELEAFSLADSSFKTPISTGSRPWGIAAWPRNRDGTQGDTLLVANSGGTLISYIDVNQRREVYRYPLPNILVYTVTSELSNTGAIIEQRTVHDFSDRPQYLATTCDGFGNQADTLGPSPCRDVFVVYSTTPTAGQQTPFASRGTVRWENLTKKTSHFFFEQAMGQDFGRSDTLEIERFPAQGVGQHKLLVPFLMGPYVDGGGSTFFSVTVQVNNLAFRDTTFVRNSGNFRRAVIGEGGQIAAGGEKPNARAMRFDVTKGFDSTFVNSRGTTFNFVTDCLPANGCFNGTPVQDTGISPPIEVSDWVANTSSVIRGAAINFDGYLSAIRADSTYIFDPTVRLQGMLQTSGGNRGLDFHPMNAGPSQPGPALGRQLAFAASSQPQIEAFNTNTYQRCLIVPTRDPIIGPIKSAVRNGGSDVVLVGATARGVVVVTLNTSQLTPCQ